MPPKKGQSKPTYTHEERTEIVERICEMYESQHATIESCCEAGGIDRSTFSLWCAKYSEYSDRYKKARLAAADHFFENILVPKAMTATEMLLTEREVEEEKEEELAYQGVRTNDSRKIKTRSKQQPNATAAIFVMKAAFPERFKERHEHSGPNGAPIQFDGLTLEEKVALKTLLQKAQNAE